MVWKAKVVQQFDWNYLKMYAYDMKMQYCF